MPLNLRGLILATGRAICALFISFVTACGCAKAQGRRNLPNPVLLSWQSPLCVPPGICTDLPSVLKCRRSCLFFPGNTKVCRWRFVSYCVVYMPFEILQIGIEPALCERTSLFNLLNTKRRLLYLKTQFVPRSKHFSSRL